MWIDAKFLSQKKNSRSVIDADNHCFTKNSKCKLSEFFLEKLNLVTINAYVDGFTSTNYFPTF